MYLALPTANVGEASDEFDPWVGKISGIGNGNPLIFLPGKFHRQRSPVGYSPWGYEESDMTEHTHTPLHMAEFIQCVNTPHSVHT